MKGQEFCPDTGKICYNTRLDAENACRGMKRNGRRGMSVYKCDSCGCYHTTSIGYSNSKNYDLVVSSKVELGLMEDKEMKKRSVINATKLQGAFDDGLRIARRNTINEVADWLRENEDVVSLCDIETVIDTMKEAIL